VFVEKGSSLQFFGHKPFSIIAERFRKSPHRKQTSFLAAKPLDASTGDFRNLPVSLLATISEIAGLRQLSA
jgi:hypothetical protein